MRTRAKPKAKQDAPAAPTPEIAEALEKDVNPPKLFILPKAISSAATIITLAHSRNLTPTRYYFCPSTGLHEFRRTTKDKTSHSSWLLDSEKENIKPSVLKATQSHGEEDEAHVEDRSRSLNGSSFERGYVSNRAEIYTATPIDPFFLVLPALVAKNTSTRTEEAKPLFKPADDLFEELFDVSKHLREVVACAPVRALLESRMTAASDIVEAGDEKMYRINNSKVLAQIVAKARRTISNGLPQSLETRFVTKPLEKPMLGVKRQSDEISQSMGDGKPLGSGAEDVKSEANESQSTAATPSSLESQTSISTTITVPDEITEETIPTNILELQRLRVAIDYIISSYLPLTLAKSLNELLKSSESPIDFKPLDAYFAEIAKLRAEATSQRSLSDFTRKRGLEDDEEAEERADKKRKQEEEEKKRKANESRGVRDLKKVNVNGMKKMSDFFKKAPAKCTKGK